MHILQVQMFSGFQLKLDGLPLTGQKMHKDSQFSRLLQMLLYFHEDGVTKEELENFVIGEQELDDAHTAFRIIAYKAKQKLAKMSLPKCDYFENNKGVYYWTKDILVDLDTDLFKKNIEEAEELQDSPKIEDEEKCLHLLIDAVYLYKGEFLPHYAAEPWVAQEGKQYRQLFKYAVNKAAGMLREREDWHSLEELGQYASSVEPFCDWEVLKMEALVEDGAFDQASDYYADVVNSYLKECGIYPSGRLMDVMDKLGNQMQHSHETLDNIQSIITEDQTGIDGGYFCSFPVFKGVYQSTMRMMERGGQSAFLMLCTLVDGKGNLIADSTRLEELSQRLNDSIRTSIRHGDIYTKYGKSQFLVFLINATRENCDLVQNRINHKFVIGRQRSGVKYHINSVICEM